MHRFSSLLVLLASMGCRVAASSAGPAEVADRTAAQACAQVRTFARAHGWSERMGDCFYDDVTIYDEQEQLFDALRSLHELPEDFAFPAGVVAALEKRHLMVVEPDVYREVAPEYAAQDDAWTRLMAHEIGHRLHVAVLRGDEDAMGPQWFFEGFAVVAAGQRLGDELEYASAQEALAGVYETGPLTYRRFGAAVRYFMQHKAALPELVARAGDPAFEAWLAEE